MVYYGCCCCCRRRRTFSLLLQFNFMRFFLQFQRRQAHFFVHSTHLWNGKFTPAPLFVGLNYLFSNNDSDSTSFGWVALRYKNVLSLSCLDLTWLLSSFVVLTSEWNNFCCMNKRKKTISTTLERKEWGVLKPVEKCILLSP